MKNQKRLASIVAVLFTIVFVGISASCSMNCNDIFDPLITKSQAIHVLNKSLTIKYKFISQENISEDKRVFNFEDANGTSFSMTSEVDVSFPLPSASESCNYAGELAKPAVQTMEVSTRYSRRGIVYVQRYADLKPMAERISKTLSMIKPLPIKRDAFIDAFRWGDFPCIYVRLPSEYETTVSHEIAEFDFICEGEELPTVEQIFTKLEGGFVDAVKLGTVQETLPEELLLKYPASRIRTVYCNGTEVKPIENSGNLGSYTFKYDETSQTYTIQMCPTYTAFERLVENLGGKYTDKRNYNSDTDRHVSWTIGANSWIDKHGNKGCNISKNGEIIIASRFADEHFTLPELEKLLDASITIDQKIPAIMITTK